MIGLTLALPPSTAAVNLPTSSSRDRSTFVDVTLPSELAAVGGVVVELVERLEQRRWHENEIFCVHLSAAEAVANAVKHGNRNDSNKTVRVTYLLDDTSILLSVQVEGRGFDLQSVPCPRQDEHLEIPSGRGLELMRSLMTDVHFNEAGNRVTMRRVVVTR